MPGMMFLSENLASGPFFGRPKCDIRTTEPPFSSTFLIVGMAARMRVSSVISSFSFRGTLKSTRIIARLPLKSYVSIDCIIGLYLRVKLFKYI